MSSYGPYSLSTEPLYVVFGLASVAAVVVAVVSVVAAGVFFGKKMPAKSGP